MSSKTYKNFINNQFVDSSSGATVEVRNPADNAVLAVVPDSSREDVDRAVQAAKKRSPRGKNFPPLSVPITFVPLPRRFARTRNESPR